MKIKRISFSLLICLLFSIDVQAVKVVFRLDDPRLVADSTSMRIVKLFNEKQVPLAIAVVPCDSNEKAVLPTDEDSLYIAELQSENIEIALHGLTHQNINKQGEFGGLDSVEAIRRIEKGKSVLQSVLQKEITTFIPPFNAYNVYTEHAMLQNGFSVLSADIYGQVNSDKIHFFPETLGHLMAKKGIWNAAKEAIMDCNERDAVCVVMFHAYDLPDETSWKALEQLLDKCKSTSEVELHTFQSLYQSGVHSNNCRYYVNQLESGLQKYCLHKGVLHSTLICLLTHVFNALCLALLPLTVLLFVSKKSIARWYKMGILVLSCSASVSIFVIAWLHLMGPISLFVCSAGTTLSLFASVIIYQHPFFCFKNEKNSAMQ